MRIRNSTKALAVIAAALTCDRADAFFHLWRFSEFFSNADGSVQFVELFTTGTGEVFAQGSQIRSASTNKTFTFPSNLSGSTTNKRLLIATPNFGSLTGAVMPDFTLPSTSFFNPASDTLTLIAGSPVDSRTITSLPTDGVTSRIYPSNTLATNSPTNFAGATGSVNLAPPPSPTGDYNRNGVVDAADYVAWRDTLGQNVSMGTGADGSGNGSVDAADYDFWRARFGNMAPGIASGAAVAEPVTVALFLVGLSALLPPLARRRAA
jgi:hypothetical protein